MRPPKLPTIIVWDLDQTMIGITENVLQLADLYKAVDFLQRAKDIPNHINMNIKHENYFETALQHLKDVPHFIRPHFKTALQSLKRSLSHCEFFVYSAGQADYVDTLIKYLEKETGVTFHRPIFSRKNTAISYNKSVDFTADAMIQSLVGKYPALKSPKNQKYVLDNGLLFVDDNDVLLTGKDQWIQCPKYSYNHVIDISTIFPKELLMEPKVIDFIISRNTFIIESNGKDKDLTADERRMIYHVNMAKLYQQVLVMNNEACKDDFLLRLSKAVKQVSTKRKTPFTVENVKKIRKLIDEMSKSKK